MEHRTRGRRGRGIMVTVHEILDKVVARGMDPSTTLVMVSGWPDGFDLDVIPNAIGMGGGPVVVLDPWEDED